MDQQIVESMTRTANSVAIEAAWRICRGAQLVPSRTEIKPRQIPPGLLPGIGLVSIRFLPEGVTAEYRLAGSRYRRITGAEITGGAYAQFVSDGDLSERVSIVRRVLEHPVGVWWISEVTIGDEIIPYASTLLPVSSPETEKSDHILDYSECVIPMRLHGGRGILSSRIIRHLWIDIGAGIPVVIPTA